MTEPRPSTFVNPQDENYVTQVPDPRQRAVMADSVVRYRRADRLAAGDAVPSLALTRLTEVRPQAAELVKLRFFSGLTEEEAAPMLGLSPRSARRLWAFARAWLRRDMERAGGPGP